MALDPPLLHRNQAPDEQDILEVASLGLDGTVNLWWGGQIITGVPASRSYRNRQPGDLVLVTKRLGRWRVDAPVGEPDDAAVTWDDIRDKPADLATSSSTADPDDITPTDRVDYQGGHKTTWNKGRPAQGSYGGNPANTGIWFYGSQVTTAVGTKTPKAMTLFLARRDTGGRPGAVPVHLYLVSEGSPPYATPSLSSKWTPDKGLTQNGTLTVTLPSNFVTALASGSSKAIAASDGVGQDYILFATCGGLHITY